MIKRYSADDLEKVAQCLKDAFIEEPWNEKWDIELAKTRIRELMSSPISIGYVYEKDNNILGVMIGRKLTYLHGIEYFIDEFGISPLAQRKGISTEMLDYVKQELKCLGFVDIVLNTVKGFPSESFYKKNGFEQKEDMIFMYHVI